MATKISVMTAVLAANLDDTASMEVVDKLGQTRKAIVAQLRTAVFAAALWTVGAAGAAFGMSGTPTVGVDQAAGAMAVTANLSTGNATPGTLVFKVGAQVAGSSAVAQTASVALTLSHTTAGGHKAVFAGAIEGGAASVTTLAASSTVGIGGAALGSRGLYISKALTAAFGSAAGLYIETALTTSANSDSLYGLRIGASFVDAGHATTIGYQLFIDDATGADTNYAIYTNTGLVRFGGATTSIGDLTVGASTFVVAAATGAIKIGNTVAAAIGIASTHKVTIDIGGTTYYLLASNV